MKRKQIFIAVTLFFLLIISTPFVRSGNYFASYDVCLQDDNSKTSMSFNSASGDYIFCVSTTAYTGRGTIIKLGNLLTLQHNVTDRKVTARYDKAARIGSATYQSASGKTIGSIKDSNTANSVCGCK